MKTITTAVFPFAVVLAFLIGRCSVQDANDLIGAGFTIRDPEGFQIREFDVSVRDTLFCFLYTYVLDAPQN